MPYSKMVEFFNSHADKWDSYQTDEAFVKIDIILDRINFAPDHKVLDVACGTGVLIPFLVKRKISLNNIYAIDIAPKMIKILKEKYTEINAFCGSYEDCDIKVGSFDKIIIFNAFPHFKDPQKIVERSYSLLNKDGQLIIAHSMNRKSTDEHHSKVEGVVNKDKLISDDEFKNLLKAAGFENILIEDKDFFYLEACKYESSTKI